MSRLRGSRVSPPSRSRPRSPASGRTGGSSSSRRRRSATPAIWTSPRFRIDVDLLRVYEARLLAGRGFEARDVGAARAAIVNRTFVDDLLEPSTGALGTQFRYAADRDGGAPSDWYEIVGVVDDFPRLPRAPGSGGEPSVYHPMASGAAHPPVLSIQYGDHAACECDPARARDRRRDRPVDADAPGRAAVGVLRRAALRVSDDGAGRRVRHRRRAPALGRRGARDDVVHDRAAHAGDRHPLGARRAAAPPAARHLQGSDAAARARHCRRFAAVGRHVCCCRDRRLVRRAGCW